MNDTQKLQPDRYSVLPVKDVSKIPELIRCAETLGLEYFIKSSYGETRFYMFFDEMGMQYFMNGSWQ